MPESDTTQSLQQRVDDYLRSKPKGNMVDGSEEKTANAIFEMLQRAETELKSAQSRVDRLRWQLAKSQS